MEEITVTAQMEGEREKLFMVLYKKAFPIVAQYIHKMGGTFEEAKDIFQEALIVYYEKSSSLAANIKDEQAYILGTARYLWMERYKKNQLHTSLEHSNVAFSKVDTHPTTSSEKLMKFLETAGQKCMALLQAFYYDKLPMTAVAARFNYASERSATVQKYKCLEKVRNTVKQKSLSYEDFFEGN